MIQVLRQYEVTHLTHIRHLPGLVVFLHVL